jgi:Cu/Ag efflux protein CusF
MSRPLMGMALLMACIWTAGCHGSTKRYRLSGRVVAKDDRAQQVSVDAGDIAGFMPAMTMSYRVKDPQEFHKLQPGDQITADLVVGEGAGNFWLEHVQVTGAGAPASGPGATRPP